MAIMNHSCLTNRILAVLLLVTMVTLVATLEVDVEDLGDEWKFIGDITPTDPKVRVGDYLNLTCSVRRKILRKYNLSSANIGFKFELTNGKIIRVNDSFVQHPLPKKPTNMPHTARMSFPVTGVDYEESYVCCILHVNDTHEVTVDYTILNTGYKPATGHVQDVVTSDFRTLKITYNKSHQNIIYVTTFIVKVRINYDKNPDAMFYDCSGRHGNMISNDTCRFHLSTITSTQGNHLIEVYVQSYNLNGSDRITENGPVSKFRLYGQYKPLRASSVQIAYKDGQWAVASWHYPPVPVALRFNISYQCLLDPEPKYVLRPIGYFYDDEEAPIQANLTGLRWGVQYDVTIISKPEVGGFLSQPVLVSLETIENVPAENPQIIPGRYERALHRDNPTKQDVVVYWEPVPADKANGRISEVQLMVVNGTSVWYHTVPDPTQRSDVIRGLDVHTKYLLVVMAATDRGYNNSLDSDVMIEVPKLQDSLLGQVPQNFTVIARGDSDEACKLVDLSWDLRHTPDDAEVTVHWCVGTQKTPGMCGPQEELHSQTFSGATERFNLSLARDFNMYMFGISVRTAESSSGIIWSLCTYDITKGAMPPRVSVSAGSTTSSLTLYLDPPSCSTTIERGYVYAYRVDVRECEEEEQEEADAEQCHTLAEKTWSIFFTNTSASSFPVTGLNHDTKYVLSVVSLTQRKASNQPLTLTLHTTRKRVEVIGGVIACLAVLVVMVVILVVKCWKNLRAKILITEPIIPHIEEDPVARQSPEGGYSDILERNDLGNRNKMLQHDGQEDYGNVDRHPVLPDRLPLLGTSGIELGGTGKFAFISLENPFAETKFSAPKMVLLNTSMTDSDTDNDDSTQNESCTPSVAVLENRTPTLRPLDQDLINADPPRTNKSPVTPCGSSSENTTEPSGDKKEGVLKRHLSDCEEVYTSSCTSDIEPYPQIDIGSSGVQSGTALRLGDPPSSGTVLDKNIPGVSNPSTVIDSNLPSHPEARSPDSDRPGLTGREGGGVETWTLESPCVGGVDMTLSCSDSCEGPEEFEEGSETESSGTAGDGVGSSYCRGQEVAVPLVQEQDEDHPEPGDRHIRDPFFLSHRPDSGIYSAESSPAVSSTAGPLLRLVSVHDDADGCSQDEDDLDEGLLSLTELSSDSDIYCRGVVQNQAPPEQFLGEEEYSPGQRVVTTPGQRSDTTPSQRGDTTQDRLSQHSPDTTQRPNVATNLCSTESTDPYKCGVVLRQ